jgi:hypothetical protein
MGWTTVSRAKKLVGRGDRNDWMATGHPPPVLASIHGSVAHCYHKLTVDMREASQVTPRGNGFKVRHDRGPT